MSDDISLLPNNLDNGDFRVARNSLTNAELGEDENVFRRYSRIFIKRKWAVIGAVAICVLVAIAIALFSQKLYRASAQLEISREADEVIDLNEKEQRPQASSSQEFYQTQYGLLRSRTLAEDVVADLRLADDTDFLLGYGSGDPESLPQERKDRAALATSIVMDQTEIVPMRMSSIVDVQFNSADPAMAAKVANSLAENFVQFNLNKRFEANAYARKFLEGELEQARKRLEDSERLATQYAGANELIDIAPVTNGDAAATEARQSLVVSSLADANTALSQARAERVAAENAYRQARRSGDGSEALVNPALNALRQQRATLSGEIEKLQTNFGPEYPPLQAMQNQAEELDRRIATESNRIRSSVSGDAERRYRQALGAEQQLASLVDQLKGQTLDQRSRSIQYNIYQREVDTNRALYDALLQRYRVVGVARSVGTNNVTIVDPAMVPGQPYRPDLRLNILLGLLAGLALGALVALLLEQLEDSAIAPEEFQRKLGIPLLGSIPALGKDDDPVEQLRDPKSPMSEGYFSALTGLQFSTSHGAPRTITITSTQPSEGKSTSAHAFARNLAKIGKRVILIDADLRNPSVHKFFGFKNEAGFSNLLTGATDIDSMVRPTDLPGLVVMSAGPIPPNPAELLSHGNLGEVIARLSAAFDHVVIDAPPVLGLADAPLLARATEAAVFVIEAGRTKAAQARIALRRLTQVNAHIIGAVLTKLDSQRHGYSYGYGYDYNYGDDDPHRRRRATADVD